MPRLTEILCIGGVTGAEPAIGQTAQWLAGHLTQRGALVERIVQTQHGRDQLVDEFRRFVGREGELFITVGGLGLGETDNTLKFMAAAAERPFEISNDALQVVQERFKELKKLGKVESERLNDHRRRMAYIPRGGVPLKNPIGLAPGLFLQTKIGTIVCLPGCRVEAEAMLGSEPLSGYLEALLGGCGFASEEMIAKAADEALFFDAVRHVRQRHEFVTISTRAIPPEKLEDGGEGPLAFRVVISALARHDEEAEDELAETAEVGAASKAANGSASSDSSEAVSAVGAISHPKLPPRSPSLTNVLPSIDAMIGEQHTETAQQLVRSRIEAATAELIEELEQEGISVERRVD